MEKFTKLPELVRTHRQCGYNCAVTILRTFDELLDLQLGENVRIAAGFGGGVGHSGCICGALNASIMVINLLAGRKDRSESVKPIYDLAAEFHTLFTKEHTASCCRIIKPKQPGGNCNDVILKTANLLKTFIQEKGLAQV